jgi:hypothetical protein
MVLASLPEFLPKVGPALGAEAVQHLLPAVGHLQLRLGQQFAGRRALLSGHVFAHKVVVEGADLGHFLMTINFGFEIYFYQLTGFATQLLHEDALQLVDELLLLLDQWRHFAAPLLVVDAAHNAVAYDLHHVEQLEPVDELGNKIYCFLIKEAGWHGSK